jgi:hypothetical protein
MYNIMNSCESVYTVMIYIYSLDPALGMFICDSDISVISNNVREWALFLDLLFLHCSFFLYFTSEKVLLCLWMLQQLIVVLIQGCGMQDVFKCRLQ